MTSKTSSRVDINEQRKHLNKLDLEIEQAIKELENLNQNTKHQAKMIKYKLTSSRTNGSPPKDTHHRESSSMDLDQDFSKKILQKNKVIEQQSLNLSPDYLIPKGDPLKELGFGSENKENIHFQIAPETPQEFLGGDLKNQQNQKFALDLTKLKAERMSRKGSLNTAKNSAHDKSVEESFVQKSNGFQNISANPESKQQSRKSSLYSKPQEYFDYQQQLRKQNMNTSKSPSPLRVEDRLMQYGKVKDEKRKIQENIQEVLLKNQTKPKKAKPAPKVRMSRDSSSSILISKVSPIKNDQSGMMEEFSSRPLPEPSSQNQETNDIFYELLKADLDKHQETNRNKASIKMDLNTNFSSVGPVAKDVHYDSKTFGLLSPEQHQMFFGKPTITEPNSFLGQPSPTLGNRNSKSPNSRMTHSRSPLKTDKSLDQIKSKRYQHVSSRYMDFNKSKSVTPRSIYELEEEKSTFRPQLSKKSLEMASKLHKGDAFQRLVSTSIHKSIENKKKIIKEVESELTFKPKINKVSEHLDENFKNNLFHGDQLHRWDQLYLMQEKYKIDNQMRKIELEKQELENNECTFQPQLHNNSYQVQREYKHAITDRSKLWIERKEKKIEKEREAVQEREIEECTFQPNIIKSGSRIGHSSSAMNLLENSQIAIRGLDQHFERVDMANRKKRELEERLKKNNGEKWKHQITIPQEFNFHISNRNYANDMSYSSNNYHSPNKGGNLHTDKSQDKIERNLVWVEKNGRGPLREHTNEFSQNIENPAEFGDAISRLHYELYSMDI